MKKAEWQAVYAPQGDALERRVRTTLDGLVDRPERAYPRRAVFVAAALVLALFAAAAVAAGLTRSARYDAKRLAYQALEEKFLRCTRPVLGEEQARVLCRTLWKLKDDAVTNLMRQTVPILR